MSIEALFATPVALPAVPKVVQQLIQSFSREDITVDQIAGSLAEDPVLTAKTLRLANSAYFHVSRRIASVDDALRMLGFAMVRNLVIGCGVVGAFKAVPGLDLPTFTRHSLHTASAARWLAASGGHNADLAFTVGLLHSIGHLVMHLAMPEETRRLNHDCRPLAAERAVLERSRFGYHHGEVGTELARRWRFPDEVALPLARVPDPLSGKPPCTTASLIHIAAWRARVHGSTIDADRAHETFPSAVAHAIDLQVAWLPELRTIGGRHPAGSAPMPPLDELSNGLQEMMA